MFRRISTCFFLHGVSNFPPRISDNASFIEIHYIQNHHKLPTNAPNTPRFSHYKSIPFTDCITVQPLLCIASIVHKEAPQRISTQQPAKMHLSQTNSILIETRNKMNRNTEDSPEVSRSAQLMYDSATWRMYYRITNARRRARLVESRPADTSPRSSTNGIHDASNPNDIYKFTYPSKSALSERKERKRSLSDSSESIQTMSDEGIFSLEL